ncbi:MAG: glutathione S-transferase family protein [Pseudomonadota bacterium]
MVLFGYRYSVYTRTVRMVLNVKNAAYRTEEIDPFDPGGAGAVQAVHPFVRVPALHVGAFELYETQAILDYLEALIPEPRLQPLDPERAARMRQVMSMADSYFYWPLVRQTASQYVFNPAFGEPVDAAELAAGIAAAPRVFDALEALGGEALVPGGMTLADCHLWPMMDYALMVPELAQMVASRAHLAAWCEAMSAHPAAVATKPDLEALSDG